MLAVIVSVSALAVSFATFWVTTQRRGQLIIVDGPAYALAMTAERASLFLSLSFTNTGVRGWPIRSVLLDAPSMSSRYLSWIATHDALPGSEGTSGRRYAAGFVVPPQSTELRIMEFQSPDPVHPWTPESFDITVLIQPGREGALFVRGAELSISVDDRPNHQYDILITYENVDEPDSDASTRKLPRWSRLARPR